MPFELGRVAKEIGAELHGDPSLVINNLASIDEATAGELSFIAGKKFRGMLESTGASALIVYPGLTSDKLSLLVVDDPQIGVAGGNEIDVLDALRIVIEPYS